MTIIIGETEKFDFEGPYMLDSWNPPYKSGVYAILKRNLNGNYGMLYTGESENLSERGFNNHHKLGCWKSKSTVNDLHVAVLLIPNSTPEERKRIEKILIEDYSPVCND